MARFPAMPIPYDIDEGQPTASGGKAKLEQSVVGSIFSLGTNRYYSALKRLINGTHSLPPPVSPYIVYISCLLYTSDAADE